MIAITRFLAMIVGIWAVCTAWTWTAVTIVAPSRVTFARAIVSCGIAAECCHALIVAATIEWAIRTFPPDWFIQLHFLP